jgi:hypothetical protein
MSITWFPLELRRGQRVDAVILGVRADEFHKSYLPAEVEGGHQAIVPSRNLEPDTVAVQDLGFRRRLLNLVRGGPMRGSDEFVPAFKRNLCFWMPPQKAAAVLLPELNRESGGFVAILMTIKLPYSHSIFQHLPPRRRRGTAPTRAAETSAYIRHTYDNVNYKVG